MKPTKTALIVYLDPDDRAKLEQTAEASERSASAQARLAIKAWLASNSRS